MAKHRTPKFSLYRKTPINPHLLVKSSHGSPNFRGESSHFYHQSPNFCDRSPNITDESSRVRHQSPNFCNESPNFRGECPNFLERSSHVRFQSPDFCGESSLVRDQSPDFRDLSPNFQARRLSRQGSGFGTQNSGAGPAKFRRKKNFTDGSAVMERARRILTGG